MGLFKNLFYAGIGASLLYGGMFYQKAQDTREMKETNSKVQYLESIDYKVESLIYDNAHNPEAVSSALEKFAKKYEMR